MKLNLIGCGGAGINNIRRYTQNGVFHKDFSILGLDTSDGNLTADLAFQIERVPNTNGSGSDPAKNADKYPDFLKRIISQYEIEGLAILVYSGSGGTGSAMGPILHEMLTSRGVMVISVVIGDMSNINGGTNTVSSMLNLNDVTEQGFPAIYAYFQNGKTTQGELNTEISNYIDTARVVLSDENQRIDTADIHHFFFYNKVVKATPILSELSFVTSDQVSEYTKNVVAAISLFDNEDNIAPAFDKMLYAKEGIFKTGFQNSKYPSIHAVLDHGDSLKGLESMLAEQRVVNAETNDRFQTNSTGLRDRGITRGKGGFVKHDI